MINMSCDVCDFNADKFKKIKEENRNLMELIDQKDRVNFLAHEKIQGHEILLEKQMKEIKERDELIKELSQEMENSVTLDTKDVLLLLINKAKKLVGEK